MGGERERKRDGGRGREEGRARHLTQSIPILRWIPTKGLSSRLEMCSSPSFTILSDHTTYCCRPTWSSTTGNWAGAPGRANTGCSEGGNLQKEVLQSTASSSSWNQCRASSVLCHGVYLLFHPLRLMVGTERNPTEQDRLVELHTNVVPERAEWIPILETKFTADWDCPLCWKAQQIKHCILCIRARRN